MPLTGDLKRDIQVLSEAINALNLRTGGAYKTLVDSMVSIEMRAYINSRYLEMLAEELKVEFPDPKELLAEYYAIQEQQRQAAGQTFTDLDAVEDWGGNHGA